MQQLSKGISGAQGIFKAFGKGSTKRESNPNTSQSRSKRQTEPISEETVKQADNLINEAMESPDRIKNFLDKITGEEIKNANITDKDDLQTSIGKILESSEFGKTILHIVGSVPFIG